MTTIEVTAEDIRIGRRGRATRCPVRRADDDGECWTLDRHAVPDRVA